MKYFKTWIMLIYFTFYAAELGVCLFVCLFVFCTPYTCLVFQMVPGNVLFHHNRHLMGYFEFWHGSRMNPLNISKRLHWQYLFKKARRGRDYHHSSSLLTRGLSFWRTTSTIQANALVHCLVHSADKTHVLGVAVDSIWLFFLNILSRNFIQTPNNSFRFRRFKEAM